MALIDTNKNFMTKKNKLNHKMGARTTEIRPVGAWVQYEPVYANSQHDAVVSAHYEDTRIRQQQLQKEQRLKEFQDGVRRRVKLLEQAKRHEQLRKSYQAVEIESNVLQQSACASEKSTPRKNSCTLRADNNHHIGKSQSSSQGCIITDQSLHNGPKPVFEDQTYQIRKHSQQARGRLTTRKVLTDNFENEDLPGGVWRTGATLDHPASRQTRLGDVIDLEEEPVDAAKENIPNTGIYKKIVQFADDPETRDERITRKSAPNVTGTNMESVPSVPVIYPGVMSEEERVRVTNQRAMYRRLFMDIEREQVKENLRRKEHRQKINSLKKEAEEKRRLTEDESRSLVEPRDPVTGETTLESLERERHQEQSLHQSQMKEQKAAQRSRETKRYLDALKRNLQEKVEQSGVELPPLCSCGATVWDTNPDTCANNCTFYRNPKAYAKVLQSLLTSCDVV